MHYDIHEIIEVLNNTELENYFDSGQPFSYADISMIQDYLPSGWEASTGCTKCVIIPPEGYDYVIKIPFTHDYWEDDYDENGDDVVPFEGAYLPMSDSYTWDYCAAEAELSELAVQEGIDKFFALTKFLVNWCHHPIYIQEKCESLNKTPEEDAKSPITRELEREANEIQSKTSSLWPLDTRFLAAGLFLYGEESLKHLNDFIADYSIQDLHNGNYGYAAGTFVPKIYDYSGYNS